MRGMNSLNISIHVSRLLQSIKFETVEVWRATDGFFRYIFILIFILGWNSKSIGNLALIRATSKLIYLMFEKHLGLQTIHFFT